MDSSSAISNNNEKMDEHLKGTCKRKRNCSITSLSEGKKKKKNNGGHAAIKKELKSISDNDIDLFEPIAKLLKRPKKKKNNVKLTKDSEHKSQPNNTSVEVKRENIDAYNKKSIENPKKKQVAENNQNNNATTIMRRRYSKKTRTASSQLRKEKYAKLRARQKARIMESQKRRENDDIQKSGFVPRISSLGPFIPTKKNSHVQLKSHIAQTQRAGNSSTMTFMTACNNTTLNTLSPLKNSSCLGSGSTSKRPSPSPSPSTTEPQTKPSGLLIRRDYRIDNWTEPELDALWLGVRRHGQGNWKAIIADLRLFPATLRHKTPQQLSRMWKKQTLKLFPSLLSSPPPPSASAPTTNTPQKLQPPPPPSSVPTTNTPQRLQPQPPPPPRPSALEKNKEKEVVDDRAETNILIPTRLDRVPPHMYLVYGIKRKINFPSVSSSDPIQGCSSSSGLSNGVTHQHASSPPFQRPSSPVYGLLATIEESSSRVCEDDADQAALSSMKKLPETEKEKVVVISESDDDDTQPQRLLLGGQFLFSPILDQMMMKKKNNNAEQKKNIEAGTSSHPFHINSD